MYVECKKGNQIHSMSFGKFYLLADGEIIASSRESWEIKGQKNESIYLGQDRNVIVVDSYFNSTV